MTTLILTLHVIASVLLVLIVLLQTGKGASMGASFGGGSSQTLFGSSGPATILGKITTGVAVIFMLTSLTLAYTAGHRANSTIMSDISVPVQTEAPVSTDANSSN